MYEPKDVCGNMSCSNIVNYGEYLCHLCKPKQVSNYTTKEDPETPRKQELPEIPSKYSARHCTEICQECFVRYGYCQAAAIRNGIKSIMYKNSIEDTAVQYDDSLQTGLDYPGSKAIGKQMALTSKARDDRHLVINALDTKCPTCTNYRSVCLMYGLCSASNQDNEKR